MILGTQDNTPVSAPHLQSSSAVLDKYRDFAGNINLTADDFYYFMTVPGHDREQFLKTLQHSGAITSSRFITQTYSL